jgi:hypothetical protein
MKVAARLGYQRPGYRLPYVTEIAPGSLDVDLYRKWTHNQNL